MSNPNEWYNRSQAERGNYIHDHDASYSTNAENERIAKEYKNNNVSTGTDAVSPFLIIFAVIVLIALISAAKYGLSYMSAHADDKVVTVMVVPLIKNSKNSSYGNQIGYLQPGVSKDSLEKILSTLKRNTKGYYEIENLTIFPKSWIELNGRDTSRKLLLDPSLIFYKKGVPLGQTRTREQLSYY